MILLNSQVNDSNTELKSVDHNQENVFNSNPVRTSSRTKKVPVMKKEDFFIVDKTRSSISRPIDFYGDSLKNCQINVKDFKVKSKNSPLCIFHQNIRGLKGEVDELSLSQLDYLI
jgi:hypothetical protein